MSIVLYTFTNTLSYLDDHIKKSFLTCKIFYCASNSFYANFATIYVFIIFLAKYSRSTTRFAKSWQYRESPDFEIPSATRLSTFLQCEAEVETSLRRNGVEKRRQVRTDGNIYSRNFPSNNGPVFAFI